MSTRYGVVTIGAGTAGTSPRSAPRNSASTSCPAVRQSGSADNGQPRTLPITLHTRSSALQLIEPRAAFGKLRLAPVSSENLLTAHMLRPAAPVRPAPHVPRWDCGLVELGGLRTAARGRRDRDQRKRRTEVRVRSVVVPHPAALDAPRAEGLGGVHRAAATKSDHRVRVPATRSGRRQANRSSDPGRSRQTDAAAVRRPQASPSGVPPHQSRRRGATPPHRSHGLLAHRLGKRVRVVTGREFQLVSVPDPRSGFGACGVRSRVARYRQLARRFQGRFRAHAVHDPDGKDSRTSDR